MIAKHRKTVIVMDGDQQILSGLVLLLEDMSLEVVAATHLQALDNIIKTVDRCPCLIILPYDSEGGTSSLDLIRRIRNSYAQNIPAILFSREDCISAWQIDQMDEAIICCELNPRQLRQHIKTLLD